jgi:hypothetical protein
MSLVREGGLRLCSRDFSRRASSSNKEFKPTDKTQLQIASVKLFNPRRQKWLRHFTWTEDGTYIVGLTACGRASVTALQLNNTYAVTVRQAWVSAGWYPQHGNLI